MKFLFAVALAPLLLLASSCAPSNTALQTYAKQAREAQAHWDEVQSHPDSYSTWQRSRAWIDRPTIAAPANCMQEGSETRKECMEWAADMMKQREQINQDILLQESVDQSVKNWRK